VSFFGDGFFGELGFGGVLIFADDVVVTILSGGVVHLLDGREGVFHLEEIYK
jgi:hypothetical protein